MKGSLKYSFFLVTTLGILLLGCTKSKVELEVEQDACKKFKTDAPSYALYSDPCDGGLNLLFDVTFTFKGESSCVKFIEVQPVFFNSVNAEISGVSYESKIEKPNFVIDEGNSSITYTYDVTFKDAAQAADFNTVVLEFNTENELGDKSNSLSLRIQTSCTTVSASDYKVISDTAIVVSSFVNTFPIELWDNAAEDGDIVSVYLNGEWIIDNFSLLNARTLFSIETTKLVSGKNDLVIFAINEGSTGPNTVSIAVNGSDIDLKSFEKGLLTGNAVEIDFK